uniref:NADH-ubiquinone oxidoreductase chain 2 n=1 Tax=Cassidinae sp. ACP-2018 TaxID=2480630 RepID=A0A3G5FNQ5_9CUCU|nr:NADH dehydrogenase subunit 2 [Cassidinae sp. ACP-2018]
MTKFYKKLFIIMTLFSTLFSISANNWMLLWIGMEINLLSVIPLFKDKSIYSTEASMKYFITQCMASSMLLASIMISEKSSIILFKTLIEYLMVTSLLIKLGAAPFHFWVPEVSEGLSWMNCLILLTWQKVAPSIFLILIMCPSMMITASIILSSLIGGIMGLNQTSLRKIMAYSSINHMAWMLASMLSQLKIWLMYFSIYLVTSMFMMYLFNKFNLFFMNQLMNNNLSNSSMILIMLNFLSLSGLPPLIGFFPKWMVIYWLSMMNLIVLASLMMILTLISIYIYLRLITPMMLLKQKTIKMIKYQPKLNYMILIINMMFLMSLMMINMIF